MTTPTLRALGHARLWVGSGGEEPVTVSERQVRRMKMSADRARSLKRMAVFGASLMLAVGAAAGCGSGGGSSAGGSKGGPVGYAAPFLTDPFQAVLQSQTMHLLKSRGVKTLSPTNANNDPGRQATDVRNLVTGGAKGLILLPVDPQAIIPTVTYANAKKIPIVTIDKAPEGGKVAMIVRANNVLMGELACKYLGRTLKGTGKVLELQGDLADINGRDRTDGFEKCMRQNYPGIQVIAKPTKWKTANAANAAQTVLTANQDLKGIYMESDSVMLSAVLNVLKRAGKDAKLGEPGHINLVSIDGTPLALAKIRSGELDAAVSQPLNLYAKYGVEYLTRALKGETFKPGPTDHHSTVVKFQGNLMDLLPSPLVTKKSVDDPQLWGNQAK
jgi:ABC-type sugar transport system substrate-binding protein